jgi:hypothetical protein
MIQPPGASFVELYANVVAANVTPVDFNLVFSRAGLPVDLPSGETKGWTENIQPVARVTLPVILLPLVLQVLQKQMDNLKADGVFEQVPKQGQ